MKRNLLILAFFVLCIQPLQAQYHITGDTIQYMDSIYWCPQWYKNWIEPANMPPNTISPLSAVFGGTAGEWLIRHVADRPIRVIGIAGCAKCHQLGIPEIGDTMTAIQEYLRIYRDRNKGGEIPLRSVPWDPTSPHRYMAVPPVNSTNTCDSAIYGFTNILPMYEVYFEDNPLIITDTFLLG